MIVTAIDPGSKRLGIAHFGFYGESFRLLSAEALDIQGITLSAVASTLESEFDAQRPGLVVVETPGAWLGAAKASRNLAGVAVLYQIIGVVRLTAERAAEVRVVSDSEVKWALTGQRSAKKNVIHGRLPMLGYALPQLKAQTCVDCRKARLADDHSPDAADAIAIGHAILQEMSDAVRQLRGEQRFKPRVSG